MQHCSRISLAPNSCQPRLAGRASGTGPKRGGESESESAGSFRRPFPIRRPSESGTVGRHLPNAGQRWTNGWRASLLQSGGGGRRREEDKPNPLADTAAHVATRAPQRPSRACPIMPARGLSLRVPCTYVYVGACGVSQSVSQLRSGRPVGAVALRPGRNDLDGDGGADSIAVAPKGVDLRRGARGGAHLFGDEKGGRAALPRAFIAMAREWAASLGMVRSTEQNVEPRF
jgi:hypothetical protein